MKSSVILAKVLVVLFMFGGTGGLIAAGGGGGGSNAADAQYKCPSGSHLNPSTGLCDPSPNPCPPGYTLDPHTNLCEPNSGRGCPPGSNLKNGWCIPHDPCDAGYHPDKNGNCVNDGDPTDVRPPRQPVRPGQPVPPRMPEPPKPPSPKPPQPTPGPPAVPPGQYGGCPPGYWFDPSLATCVNQGKGH